MIMFEESESSKEIGIFQKLLWIIYKEGEKRHHMSLVMRKPAFCICENKEADQLGSNCAADQRLCFRNTDSTIPLLPKTEISSL